MGKRKGSIQSLKTSFNGETDLELQLKRFKPASRQHSSPMSSKKPTRKKSKRSNEVSEEKTYPNFSSLLKSFSLDSDSEEEIEQSFQNKQDSSTSISFKDTVSENVAENKSRKSLLLQESFMETTDRNADNIWKIKVHSRDIEIACLKHPSCLTLHGYVQVNCIFGQVSILGHELSQGQSLSVLSREASCLLQLIAVLSVHQPVKDNLLHELRRLIPEEKTNSLENFVRRVDRFTSVVLIKRALLPPNLRFLELYMPGAVQPRKSKIEREKEFKHEILCSTQKDDVFNVHPEYEILAKKILHSIDQSCDSSKPGMQIITYGSSQSGKSSLLRYLINCVLNKRSYVYYLDIDPGQSEFTPPGCVCLTKLSKPILGPPFGHQQQPVKMIFTGAISPETSPPMYIKSVQKLVDTFFSKCAGEILFVNTMGWIHGIGGKCFEDVMKSLRPTIMLDLTNDETITELTQEDDPSTGMTKFRIPSKKHKKSSLAADCRNYALLSYLGKCQPYYQETAYLEAFRPLQVCWDKVAIYVMGKQVPPNRLVEAIQCSVVALCYVSPTLMLQSENLEFPRTLCEDPLNTCLGYGVVRAADETNRLLYVVTPLSVEEICNANAIIKGNIHLPKEVFFKQNIFDVPLPYTDDSKGTPSSSRKNRKSKISITQTPRSKKQTVS